MIKHYFNYINGETDPIVGGLLKQMDWSPLTTCSIILYPIILSFVSTLIYHCYFNKLSIKDLNFNNIKASLKHWKFLMLNLVLSILIIFILIYRNYDLFNIFKLITLVSLLQPIAIIDYREKIIPNKILLIILALGIIWTILQFIVGNYNIVQTLLNVAMGILVICGILLIMSFIIKGGIGMGDIKLLAIMCLYEGLYGTLNTVIVSLLASFVYAVYLLIRKKANRNSELSFGTFLYIGLIISCLMGVA